MKKTIMLVVVFALFLPTEFAKADFTFGEPVLFDEPVNSAGPEFFECISANGLELYIERTFEVAFPALDWDLYVSTRETTGDPWSVPVSLGSKVNSDYTDIAACLSADGLELYFASNRTDGHGSYDIWVATRPDEIRPLGNAGESGAHDQHCRQRLYTVDNTRWPGTLLQL